MGADKERHYVLKGTVCLNGTVFLGGTRWVGYPSSVVVGYVALSCRGQKVLLEPSTVETYFSEVEAPAAREKAGAGR